MNSSPSLKLLPSLTGLRFLSVVMIFMFHYNSQKIFGTAVYFINHLYTGVTIFFVLSGFLITYHYYGRINTNRNEVKKYFVNRFARVYPLFFLLTTFTFSLFFLSYPLKYFPWKTFFYNIFFVKGYSLNYLFSGINTTWSLCVEVLFYILAPFIFWFINKKYFFIQPLFFAIITVFLSIIFTIFPYDGFFYNYKFTFISTFFGRSFEFFVGIWLALYVKKRIASKREVCREKENCCAYTLGGSISIVLLIIFLHIVNPRLIDTDPMNWASIFVTIVIFPFAVAMLMFGLICENSFVNMFLRSKLIQLLGKSSYAFFLVHTGFFAKYASMNFFDGNILLLFIFLWGLSILLYLFVENPINRWLRRKIIISN